MMKPEIVQSEFSFSPVIANANYRDLRFLAMNLRPEDRLELGVTRDVNDWNGLAWAGAYAKWRKVAIWDRRPVFAFGATEIENQPKAHVWGFGCVHAVHALKPVTR